MRLQTGGFGFWDLGLSFGFRVYRVTLQEKSLPELKGSCSWGPLTGWFLVGNEGMRALYSPLKGKYRALIPSFPTKNQEVKARAGFGGPFLKSSA